MRKHLLIGTSALALVAAACGGSSGEITDLTDDAPAQAEEATAATLADGDTVEIAMTEFAYDPAELTVPVGATVTFTFANQGEAEHEAVIGDIHMQEEHEAAMAAGMDQGAMEEMNAEEAKKKDESKEEEGHAHEDGSSDHHDGDEAKSAEKSKDKAAADEAGHDGMEGEHGHGAGAITVQAGEDGSLEYTFEEAGTFLIGCHIPGHWDAGMQATITVV